MTLLSQFRRSCMDLKEISQIEDLLFEFQAASDENLQRLLINFIEGLCKLAELAYCPQDNCDILFLMQEALLSKDNTAQQKKIVAACLLRLLCNNHNAIWSFTPFRVKDFQSI